jgi:hypothetical protein
MKTSIILILLICAHFVGAQTGLYTPGQTIAGSSGNNNVGIGKSSPVYTLDVAGTIQSYSNLRTTVVATGNGYFADDGAGSTIFSISRQTSNEVRFQAYGFHTFYSGSSSGSERMRIAADGSVGIGRTNPAYLLDVYGTIRGFGNIRTTSVGDGNGYISDDGAGSTIFSLTRRGINNEVRLQAYGFHTFYSGGNTGSERMRIDANGNVGIGSTAPDSKLTVKGVIHAEEVKVDISVPGPDYVFEKNYKLPSLTEIKKYIDQNKHLPEVPSAAELEKDGVELSKMNMLLLKKIEELTLYLIDQQKINEAQAGEIEQLKKAVGQR